MPSSFTENFQLSQWEARDKVLRTDFNEDNQKLETALCAAQEELSELRRIITNMAYHVGQLSIVDLTNRRKHVHAQAFYAMRFFDTRTYRFTGGVTAENDVLILNGQGASGSASVTYLLYDHPPRFTQLRMWIHHVGGSVTPTINQNVLTKTSSFGDFSALTELSTCSEYVVNLRPGTEYIDYNIELALDCGSDSSMAVHDYVIAFL